MKARASLVLMSCLALAGLSGTGCGEGDGGTFLVVNVDRGAATGPIGAVALTLDLGGRVASRTIDNLGGELTLPFSVGFQIASGEGPVVVSAVARNLAGIEIARGTGTATIARNQTITVQVVLGGSGAGDGGPPPGADGGVDEPDAPITPPVDGAPPPDAMPPVDQAVDGPAPPTGPRIEADRMSIDFGTVVTGSQADVLLTVSNTGDDVSGALVLGLSGPGASSFSLRDDACSGNGLEEGGSCTVTVRVAPATAGAAMATLTVIGLPGGSAQVTLGVAAVAPGALAIDPASHAFADVAVGGSDGPQTFTVSNGGGAALGPVTTALTGNDVPDMVLEADECAGKTLMPNQSCTVAVRFAPKSAGRKSASLTATAEGGGTAVATLSGRGLRPAALSLSPASHDFGGTVQGESSGVQTFKLKNDGEVESAVPSVTVMGEFVIRANGCASALAAGAECGIDVAFVPASVGAKTGSLHVTAGALMVASSLAGNGLSPGDLRIEPGSQDFGAVTVGALSNTFMFTVRNNGQGETGALAVTKSGAHAADFQIVGDTCTSDTLTANQSCVVTLRLQPTAAGSRSATLQVSASPGGNVSASLSGTGLTVANLSVNPAGQAFGDVVTGTSSDRSFTVSNTGQSISGGLMLSLGGLNAGEFQLLTPAGMDCVSGNTLASGASCTVRVRFAPTTVGSKVATLTVQSSPGGSKMASLTGTGLAPGQLQASASAHDFGGVEVGASSQAFVWTLTNTGGVATGVPALTNSNATDFQVVNNCLAALNPGLSCTISVTFKPSTGGARNGSLQVTATPGGSVSLNMTGKGQYRLGVRVIGSGRGRVTSSPAGIDCTGSCGALFDPGTALTLTAITQNGDDSYFRLWAGAPGCVGPNRTCVFTLSSSLTVDATFDPQPANLVFASSKTLSTAEGGVETYHKICNDLASNAGINTNAGDGFRAWMSDEKQAAADVVSLGEGWVRMDGKPFTPTLAALVKSNVVMNPVRFDEFGVDSGSNLVMTGTNAGGSGTGNDCKSWATATNDVTMTWGSRVAGPGAWTYASDTLCSNSGRVYCFGVTKQAKIDPQAQQGLRVFLSNTAFQSGAGIELAHKLCDGSAPTGVLSARALLSDGITAAGKYLSEKSLYVRPDGQAVGYGIDILKAGALQSGIWQSGDGTYQVNQLVYTGSETPADAGTSTTTCDGWLSLKLGAVGSVGRASYSDGWFWFTKSTQACTLAQRIYCVEQP